MADVNSARAFFVTSVIPSYERFVTQLLDGVQGGRRDTAALGEAAGALLHLADYTAREAACKHTVVGAPKSDKYVRQLTSSNWWFAATRDIANVIKHREINRDGRLLDSLDDVKEYCVIARYEDSEGYYCDVRKAVLVRFKNGIELAAEVILRQCLSFWVRELIKLKVISGHPKIDHGRTNYRARNEVPSELVMRQLAQAGEQFHAQNVVLHYDSESDRFVRGGSRGPFKADVRHEVIVSASRFEDSLRADLDRP